MFRCILAVVLLFMFCPLAFAKSDPQTAQQSVSADDRLTIKSDRIKELFTGDKKVHAIKADTKNAKAVGVSSIAASTADVSSVQRTEESGPEEKISVAFSASSASAIDVSSLSAKDFSLSAAAENENDLVASTAHEQNVDSPELEKINDQNDERKQQVEDALKESPARKALFSPASSKIERKPGMGFVMADGDDPSRIVVSPGYLIFHARDTQPQILEQTFVIKNSGDQVLNYSLSAGASWIGLNKSSGTVDTQDEIIAVTVNTSSLSAAQQAYTADITINNGDSPEDYRKLRVMVRIFSEQTYTRTYAYDANDNIVRRQTENGDIVDYEYDSLNRLSSIKYPDGTETAYEYDANGNRISMTDPTGTIEYWYDAFNRLRITRQQYANGDMLNPVYYNYDKANRLTEVVYPDQKTVVYTYNPQGMLASVESQDGITSYAYSIDTGNLIKKTLPNGVYTDYVYDGAKRITDVVNSKSDDALISSYHYDFDANGNRNKITEIVHQDPNNAGSPQITKVTDYTYDDLNRLLSAVYVTDGLETLKEEYTYDPAGNRLAKVLTEDGSTVVENIVYEYDSDNRLIMSEDSAKDEKVLYFYDKNGNMIRKVTKDREETYGYDFRNKLISYSDGNKNVAYQYNGDGDRVSKTVNGNKTLFITDKITGLERLLMEITPDYMIKSKYTYGIELISKEDF